MAGQAGMVMTALYSELFTHGGRVFHFGSLMGSQRRWPLGQGASALCLIINSATDGRERRKNKGTNNVKRARRRGKGPRQIHKEARGRHTG